jgi:thymidylate kinase
MLETNERYLIIITGPVGAGKSTTSLALAQALRRPDIAVAVIDLDQMYGFVRQQPGYGEQTAWLRARQGAAALADCWFATGMSVVIVDGEFFNAEELNALLAPIQSPAVHAFFTLQITYESALERVQGDPSRGDSKNPAFLKWLHSQFVQALPFLEERSIVINTDALTLDQVVARLITTLEQA